MPAGRFAAGAGKRDRRRRHRPCLRRPSPGQRRNRRRPPMPWWTVASRSRRFRTARAVSQSCGSLGRGLLDRRGPSPFQTPYAPTGRRTAKFCTTAFFCKLGRWNRAVLRPLAHTGPVHASRRRISPLRLRVRRFTQELAKTAMGAVCPTVLRFSHASACFGGPVWHSAEGRMP